MTLIDKIKVLFETVKPAIAETFKDVKTTDGVILRIEGDLAEGAIVSEVSADGQVQVVGTADYTLEDGTVISTDGTGAIVKIVAAEPVEAAEVEIEAAVEPVVAPAVEETPAEETGEEDKVTALEAKVAELEAAVQVIAEQCKAMMDANSPEAVMAAEEMKKENKSLKKTVKELSAEPAVPAANFKKVTPKEQARLDANVAPIQSEMMKRLMRLKEKEN